MPAKNQPTSKNRGGRPSKKARLDLKQIKKLARKGWTDAQLAEFFEVGESTWYRWKAEDPRFWEALKEWKDEADARVERSLYERATGYSHPDVHVSNFQGQITITPLVKHYPPDTTAAIFWLKNRDPANWRDKQDHEHTGRNGGAIEHDVKASVVVVPTKEAGIVSTRPMTEGEAEKRGIRTC